MLKTSEPEPKFIEIRSSGLPNAQDCWRKWAAQLATDPTTHFAPVMQGHGFNLSRRGTGNNPGNVIGSACHEAFGFYFQAKIDGRNFQGAEDIALMRFRKDLGAETDIEAFFTDKVTKDASVAETQISRMIQAYLPRAESVQPKRIEFSLKCQPDLLKNYLVTGHPDRYEMNESVVDMKFGSHCGAYEAQLGAYSLMMRSSGMPTTRLFVDWLPRCTIKKEQKPLEIIEYSKFTAENAASHLIEEALERLEKFKESGDPWSFMANPNSNLCSRKWCNAWGTPFCDLGRPEKQAAEE